MLQSDGCFCDGLGSVLDGSRLGHLRSRGSKRILSSSKVAFGTLWSRLGGGLEGTLRSKGRSRCGRLGSRSGFCFGSGSSRKERIVFAGRKRGLASLLWQLGLRALGSGFFSGKAKGRFGLDRGHRCKRTGSRRLGLTGPKASEGIGRSFPIRTIGAGENTVSLGHLD
jgi:hypothetical protein